MLKIISGSQTGVDRGALDAALEVGAECGGWCPAGRLAEDGTIPPHYPLREMPSTEYSARTRQNVADSDGTLIICYGEAAGGTRQTIEFCRDMQRPHLVVDAKRISAEQAIELAVAFVREVSSRVANGATDLAKSGHSDSVESRSPLPSVTVLNVAGPRASQWPDGYEISRQIVSALLRRVSGHKDDAA